MRGLGGGDGAFGIAFGHERFHLHAQAGLVGGMQRHPAIQPVLRGFGFAQAAFHLDQAERGFAALRKAFQHVQI